MKRRLHLAGRRQKPIGEILCQSRNQVSHKDNEDHKEVSPIYYLLKPGDKGSYTEILCGLRCLCGKTFKAGSPGFCR
jgi:hypothetical protein